MSIKLSPFPPPGYFLRIKDWDKHFERAQTRRIKGPLGWVSIPTKQDGFKFSRLLARQNGFFCLGIFITLVEIGAKTRERGVFLGENGEPMGIFDFSRMSGGRPQAFLAGLEVLTSKEIGWIELIACSDYAPSPLIARSDMYRKGEGKERKGNGFVPFHLLREAVAITCALDLELIDERMAQKVSILISDFQARYPEWSEKELARGFKQFGRWYYEEEWKGHRPTLEILRAKWGAFEEWAKKKTGGSGNPEITAPG